MTDLNYTEEQLRAAIQRAYDANDISAANEIADVLAAKEQERQSQEQTRTPYTASPSLSRIPEAFQNFGQGMVERGQEFAQRVAGIVQEPLSRNDPNTPPGQIPRVSNQRTSDPVEKAIFLTTEAGVPLIGGAIIETGELLGRLVGQITPNQIEEPIVNAAIGAADSFMSLPAVQTGLDALSKGVEAFEFWRKSSPENAYIARRLGGILDIGGIFAGPKVRPITSVREGLAAGGENLIKGARKTRQETREAGIQRMLEPPQAERQGETVLQGRLKTKTWVPSENEAQMISIVESIPNINHRDTFTVTFNKLRDAISAETNRLTAAINRVGNPRIDTEALTSSIQTAIKDLQNTGLTFVGDPSRQAERLFERFNMLLSQSDGSASSVLQIRRELDNWIRQSSDALSQSGENPIKAARRVIATEINNAVNAAVPDNIVRTTLERQTNMYRAADILEVKAIGEANNAISRLLANIERSTGFRHPTTPLAATATVGAAGYAASQLSPWLTIPVGLAAAGFGLTELAKTPTVRELLGKTLQKANKALRVPGLSEEMLTQLRADRLVVVTLLNELTPEEERPPLRSAGNQ